MRASSISPFAAAALGCAAFIALAAPAWAQYKIVGPDGRVTYTDQRPTGGTAVKPALNSETGAAPQAALPYALRQATGKYPVTLYTSPNCQPCANGRALLTRRGIPFAERTVDTAADIAALQRISGSNSMPVLAIGEQLLRGLVSSDWHAYLDAAGYPSASALPANWQNPAPQPLAPAAPAADDTPAQPPAPAAVPPERSPQTPSIRF